MPLDYESLPREYHRTFLAEGVDSADWSSLERFFDELQERRIRSVADLQAWLEDYSEVFVAVSEAASIRFIHTTEMTDKKEYQDAYAAFLENVEPRVKLAQFNLNRKFVESEFRALLPRERYGLLERKIENSVRLFRASNVELEKEEKRLALMHQNVTGAMTVSYGGQERTVPEMSKYLESNDPAQREQAWRLIQARYSRDRDQLEGIFDRMISLRDRIARNAGFASYRDYSFLSRERFDYGPDDCARFHEAIEKHIVPLVRDACRKRQTELGLESLRPWDIVANPVGRVPLLPFRTTDQLVQGCEQIFGEVDPAFSDYFRRMMQLRLLDLESRPGKAHGGYETELLELRLPFIFMNSVGRDQDMRTLLHESGHAFHSFETRNANLHYLYRGENIPAEIAEVASMSMELLGGEHIKGIFYDETDAARSRYDHMLSIARLLPWISTIDAFQHWLYTNPGHTREERGDAWERTYDRFSPEIEWGGLEEAKRYQWHRQTHLFQTPFYYFEYGIAQLGALGVWMRYERNPREAVASFRAALALGGSRPLPELFKRAGLPWGFGADVVGEYATKLRRVLLP
jgi:oligoendopeptidase F